MNLNISDVRPFIPAKDFDVSKLFYQELGWILTWSDEDLAVMEQGEHRFYLQNYYVKKWADNTMLHVSVEDALAWKDKVSSMIDSGHYPGIRVSETKRESYGAYVTYVWDPSGVLLHFSQWD
jgi:predicted lactoylglutathione lyase